MKTNPLFHVLLMSGALMGCAAESNDTDTADKTAEVDAAASTKDTDADIVDANLALDADSAGVTIPGCNENSGDAESHACTFAGEASGQEACALVEDGKDLCCCWAPMTC